MEMIHFSFLKKGAKMSKYESAFPLDEHNSPADTQRSLTKREWFAGMAIHAMTSIAISGVETNTIKININETHIAASAFKMADAMIEASKKKDVEA